MHNNILKKKINKAYIPAVSVPYFSKNCRTTIQYPYPKTYLCSFAFMCLIMVASCLLIYVFVWFFCLYYLVLLFYFHKIIRSLDAHQVAFFIFIEFEGLSLKVNWVLCLMKITTFMVQSFWCQMNYFRPVAIVCIKYCEIIFTYLFPY